MNKLFCLIGKSACGKSSVALELNETYPICKSLVTRPPRDNSSQFDIVLTEGTFKIAKEEGFLCQYFNLPPNWYGMTKVEVSPVKKNIKSKICVLATWESVIQLQEYLGKDKVVTILIEREDEEIKSVLNQRGELSGSRLNHIQDIDTHNALKTKVDHIVYNKNLSETIETVKHIIINEIQINTI